MTASDTVVEALLAFTRPSEVGPDSERRGLLRARTRSPEQNEDPASFDHRLCRLTAWGGAGFRPGLLEHGFESVDLSGVDGLLPLLERIRDAGEVRPEDAREVRRRLAGLSFPLGDGSLVRFVSIAPEGFIMRRAGPAGMAMSPPEAMTPMNGHDAARTVHADQDILGTPLRQLMRGAAPWLFRHDAPDSRNRWSPVLLLNLWIPLQQITRPLALMDKRTLDRRAHQLRYGLPTERFLDRDEDRRVNDIWTFLHDDGQRWYFRDELPLGHAYVFETLGTPHASFAIPGEERAALRHRQLAAAREAVARGDAAGLRSAVRDSGADGEAAIGTRPLARAVEAMETLLAEADRDAEALCRGEGAEAWRARAGRATDAVVRSSIEMRVVAVRRPRWLSARRPRTH